MEEIWLKIPRYYTTYEASNTGKIRRVGRQTPVRMFLNNRGYYKVVLSVNNIQKNELVHRLIAETFVKNITPHNVVNHIDECQTNNQPENLEWGSQRHNIGAWKRNMYFDSQIKMIDDLCNMAAKKYQLGSGEDKLRLVRVIRKFVTKY